MFVKLTAAIRPVAVKAVIFDFDGTLADTFAIAVEVYNSVAVDFGCRIVKQEEIPAARKKSARQLMGELGVTKRKLPRLAARCLKLIHQKMECVLPFPGITASILTLKNSGLILGILTSNSCENVEVFLRKNDLEKFDFVRSSSRLFGKAKEIRSILKEYGWKPSEVAFVGDECRDMEAGAKAKVVTVAVGWGFNLPEALLEQKPDLFLQYPEQLSEAFQLKSSGRQDK
ncbi:MAG: HAD-IA family hydrolase [Chthoniobacterales bacterium]|nr:HAD-IA family hydrolase [Chthoniobacterales bacterium]